MSIYVNRTINLKKITHVGFDMDLTLISYHIEKSEGLAYSLAQAHLAKHKKYPKSILDLSFEPKFAIRGLVIDKSLGHILKLNRFGAVRRCIHGKKALTHQEIGEVYPHRMINIKSDNIYHMDTDFDKSTVSLFRDLVDFKENHPDGKKLPNFKELFEDVFNAIATIHCNDELKSHILKNINSYIIPNKKVVQGLLRLLKHKKTLFLLTNSEPCYTKALMDYAVNPFLEKGQKWEDLFSYIITYAQKPLFFFEDRPFLTVTKDKKVGEKHSGKIKEHEYYAGGSAKALQKNFPKDASILYIGDHVFSDILKLKKHCSWHTGLVLASLTNEIKALKKNLPNQKEINTLMAHKIPLEKRIDQLITKKIEEPDSFTEKNQLEIDESMKNIKEIDTTLRTFIVKGGSFFNEYWGPLFKVGAEESFLSFQVEAYAEFYMEHIEDFLGQSPHTYYRSSTPIKQMPHEIFNSN